MLKILLNKKNIYQFCQLNDIQHTYETNKFININQINHRIKNLEYIRQGTVRIRAQQIKEALKNGNHNYTFDTLTEFNIESPQIFGQMPLSFNRQVLSCILHPELIETDIFNKDVKNRAIFYTERTNHSISAYSDSIGHKFVRESVAKYIANRDNHLLPPDISNIILTDGTTQGINLIITALVQDTKDGIMIPIPQYPLYSAICNLQGASQIHYFLDESQGWEITKEELQRSYKTAKMQDVNPKILIVTNPGNPTGRLFSYETIKNIIEFAYDNKMVILADEVYQENAFQKKFFSFKKVRAELSFPYNNIELFSFNSSSKGLLGECGFRGGYVELFNIDESVKEQIIKLKSMFLCSNTIGQYCVELMCNPPNPNNCSSDTVQKYMNERNKIFEIQKNSAEIISDKVNQMENISMQQIQGATYGFPRVNLSNQVIQEAIKRKMEPDLFYCLNVLENTGIALIPGSMFGQEEGSYHFRITTLIQPENLLLKALEKLNKFNDYFHQQYK